MNKKERFFKTFAKNFSLVVSEFFPEYPHLEGSVACPLCGRLYDKPRNFTEGHFWPQKLGGKEWTLCCAKCNSNIGSSIESQEIEKLRYLAADKIHVRLPLTEAKGNITADFWISENEDSQRVLNFEEWGGNIDASKEQLTSGELKSSTIEVIHMEPYKRENARLTYLHHGYLCLFHHFGYQWALSSVAYKIREQLESPSENIYRFHSFDLGDNKITDDSERSATPIILKVKEPRELEGFMVLTPALPTPSNRRVGTLFPLRNEKIETPPTEAEVNGRSFSFDKLGEHHSKLEKPGAERIITSILSLDG